MKKLAAVFLSMLAAPLILAQACTAQQPGIFSTDGGLRVSVTAAAGSRTCTITFKTGNITTDGCDFSLPLKTPKISPIGTDQVKIEFDQSVSFSTGTTSYTMPKDRQQ